MKKLLSLLFVTVLLQVNAQNAASATTPLPSNPVSNILLLSCTDYSGIGNAITVPQGKFWRILYKSGSNEWIAVSQYIGANTYTTIGWNNFEILLPEGTQVFYNENANCTGGFINVAQYDYSTGESLSYNDIKPIEDRIKLFPNPTTNQLALNSDKDYQIEVFDLSGNKVMELKGNTINVEHLSSATYIVNAIDLETKESLSYKVVKK